VADRYLSERQALIASVTAGRGQFAPGLRRAILNRARGQFDGDSIPAALVGFVDRVANDATLIGDSDVHDLIVAGFDDEAVFEAVVARRPRGERCSPGTRG